MRAESGPAEYGAAPLRAGSDLSVLTAAWLRANRRAVAAATAVIGFWAAAALCWPLTGTVVPWDAKNHFYPMLRFLGDAMSRGELPFWNPYHFSGHPTSADPQSLLFSPTMLLFAFLVPRPSMELFDLAVFAHLLPGALAMLPIFARRGWRLEGGVVAAFIFILGGSASARLQHTGIILGYGWFPLAFWLLEEALDRRSYGWSAGFGLVASLMVIGRDQVAFLSGLTLIGLAIHHAVSSGRPLRFVAARAGQLVLMAAVGVALLSVPVILTAQLLATSTRPSFGFGVAAMGSLPPSSLATALFANVFGSLRHTYDYWGPDWSSLAEGTWTDRATNYLFAGTVPGLLVLWHGVAAGRLLAREFRFFLVVGTVTLVYALGRYTPAFSVIFDSLPGVDLYRRPADATFLLNIVLAFAAGYLVHRFLRDGAPRACELWGTRAAMLRTAFAAALAIAAVGAALAYAVPAGHAAAAAAEVGLTAAVALVLLLGLRAATPSPSGRVLAAFLMVAFTGAELVARNAASALAAEPAGSYAVFDKLPPDQARGLAVLRRELAARHAAGEHPRVEILGLPGGWQNASMALGLENTVGYNPLRLAEYQKAVGPGENAADANLRLFPGTFRGYQCRLAGLLGLEYLVLDRPLNRLPKHFARLTGATAIYSSPTMWIYRLSGAAPRAYIASHLVAVDTDAVLEAGETPSFDRATTALIDRREVDRLQADYGLHDDSPDPAPATGSVTVTRYGDNDVTLTATTDRNAVVVLHDIYYPGWVATVDGKTVPILRTNLLFRGVEVGPGRHEIRFHFAPLSPTNVLAAVRGLLHGHAPEDSADAATE